MELPRLLVNSCCSLLALIDEPGEFLPSDIPSSDLLLALIESDGAAQFVPALARLGGVKAGIIPVDNPAWLPLGLQNQIKQELGRDGVNAVFPRTFCTLTEASTGFRDNAGSYEDEIISSQQEEIDKGVFEPFMNISGYVMNDEVGKELKSAG